MQTCPEHRALCCPDDQAYELIASALAPGTPTGMTEPHSTLQCATFLTGHCLGLTKVFRAPKTFCNTRTCNLFLSETILTPYLLSLVILALTRRLALLLTEGIASQNA